MATVIEGLREDHWNMARLLKALERQIEVFEEAGAPDYDVIRGIADYFLEYPDRCHHPKEDSIFRRIEQEYPKAAAAIGNLPAEHKAVHERAVRFRGNLNALLNDTDIARSAVVIAARAFIEAERRHMWQEERRFFPLAEQMLTPADWSHVEHQLADGRDALFGDRVEGRFSRLRERLLAWEQEYQGGEAFSQQTMLTR